MSPRTLFLLLFAALCGAAILSADLDRASGSTGSAPSRPGDLTLYGDIAEAVGRGENYYHAAIVRQRAGNYPLQPFVTVRLPTLAVVTGALGAKAALIAGLVVSIATAAAWYAAVPTLHRAERMAMALLVVLPTSLLLGARLFYLHEWWAGLLVSLALALALAGRFAGQIAVTALALAIREHVVLFVLATAASAAFARRWTHVFVAGAVIAAFALALAIHGFAVAALVGPDAPQSQGWFGFLGISGFARDLAFLTALSGLPPALAAVGGLLPLLGWSELALRGAWLPLLWFSGFALVYAIIPRADNLFWMFLVLPAYLAGLACVPRFLVNVFREAGDVCPGCMPR